jgi:hypothetical protein
MHAKISPLLYLKDTLIVTWKFWQYPQHLILFVGSGCEHVERIFSLRTSTLTMVY